MIGRIQRRRAHQRLLQAGADPRLLRYLERDFRVPKKQALTETRFVVLDTETTGLDPHNDRMLSMAAVGVKQGAIHLRDRLELTLEGASVGGAHAAPVHGLVTRDLEDGSTEEQAVLQFIAFIGPDVLVAHHAAFDLAVLGRALARLGAPSLANPVVDTGHLAQRLDSGPVMGGVPRPESRSLDALAARFGFDIPHRHSASGDALVTAQILLALLSKARARGILTLGELLAR